MEYWHARAPQHRIGSIFFGGGTPSLMEPETVAAIIDQAAQLWPVDADIEITLEANPTSVEAAKFRALRAAGVNRVSLGVQSLNPESLAFLGREHSADEALKAIELSQQIFPRSSFDLIYALPTQTLQSWERELRAALTYAQRHLSLYQLTIEENTAFHHAYHVERRFALPEENLAADLFALTQDMLRDAGLAAYEISNHAAPGEESRHNLAYWRGDCYFGVGPGAHGRVDFADGARRATRNQKSPERWIGATECGPEEELTLTPAERAEEKILMGLRLSEGFALARLRDDERAYLDRLWSDGRREKLVAQSMLDPDSETLRATPAGRPVLNSLIQKLLG
jgi:putative oxygen-independent coproporphyrinogen III oxidase